ncbi:MAG: ornithine carbamoyltransferase, partial [Clostridia bacterium]|nr:ornithine carbamoyltransferase [Clostridia bacterium]
AKEGSIPVINGLTDDYHPCQVVADLMTVYENFGTFENLKLAYLGDGNNMTHSLMLGCAKMGIDFYCACPKNSMPKDDIVALANKAAQESGSKVVVTDNPEEAARDAHVIYTDVWCSMGQDAKDNSQYMPYQVNKELFAKADSKAIFLHCLPAHREEEYTAENIDGPQSKVFDEAENRLHAQKAIMALLMGDKEKVYEL